MKQWVRDKVNNNIALFEGLDIILFYEVNGENGE